MNADVRNPKRFQAALMRTGPIFHNTGVNLEAMRRDAGEGLRLASRLHDYQRYLAQARAFKAEAAVNPAEIDREVLAHGRQAATDGRMLAAAFLKTVRNLHNGGALDRLASSWRSAVQTVGTVSAQAEWDRSLADPEIVRALRDAGAGEDLVAALGEGLRSSGLELTVEGTHLVATGTVAGRRVSGRVNTAPRPVKPTSVVDLLTRGRFAGLVEMSAAGEPAYLQGVPVGDPNDARPTDVALLGAFGTHRELVRHLRKLEDTGLATVHGAGGAAVLLAIALAILIIGAMLSTCKENEPPTGACAFGMALTGIAFALLLVQGARQPDPTSVNLALGGPIVHGILRDVGTAAA